LQTRQHRFRDVIRSENVRFTKAKTEAIVHRHCWRFREYSTS